MSKRSDRLKRKAARVISTGAPLAGLVFGGAGGAALATAGSVAAQKALLKKEDEKKAIRRAIQTGGAITLGGGILAALGGSSATAGLPTIIKNLAGGKTGSPGNEAEGAEPLPSSGSSNPLQAIAEKLTGQGGGGGSSGGTETVEDGQGGTMSAAAKPNYLAMGALALVAAGGLYFVFGRKRRKSA